MTSGVRAHLMEDLPLVVLLVDDGARQVRVLPLQLDQLVAVLGPVLGVLVLGRALAGKITLKKK